MQLVFRRPFATTTRHQIYSVPEHRKNRIIKAPQTCDFFHLVIAAPIWLQLAE